MNDVVLLNLALWGTHFHPLVLSNSASSSDPDVFFVLFRSFFVCLRESIRWGSMLSTSAPNRFKVERRTHVD